jgi:high-affinity iron transporter
VGRLAKALAACAAAGLVWAAAVPAATPAAAADSLRLALGDAESALVLGDRAEAVRQLHLARRAAPAGVAAALDQARRAAASGDQRAFAAAKATAWSSGLRTAFVRAVAAAGRGDAEQARAWLLVREFRPPTRFSRAGVEGTVALDELDSEQIPPARAAAIVRRDLLDTYDARLRTTLTDVAEASSLGFDIRRAEAAARAAGLWRILAPTYRRQRGAADARRANAAVGALVKAATEGDDRVVGAARARFARLLSGFRAVPLAEAEQLRRAGQLQRFLELVPIEYDRGVEDGRVTLAFEIQEAITFRDGAEAAYRDLEPLLVAREAVATRRLGTTLELLGRDLANAARSGPIASPETVEQRTDEARALTDGLFPEEWKEAAKAADFDVISATLNRLEAAARAGEWGRAESARLEAYGVFELGPEQRLRGLAPSLFQDIEGLFWYGAQGHDGLVQAIKRKAAPDELAEIRSALDERLVEAESRIGEGAESHFAVVSNSAVIVFREGLEAVLILAALMAGMIGIQRRQRRPLLAGVAVALVASALTWVVAETVLTSLARYGERLEAVVSLVAIGVLLLILNWFYHRVYWQEHLQGLHGRKRRLVGGATGALTAAQVTGLAVLGFTSVYREGFETVLFLQALTLEAGVPTVLEGVAIGLAATLAVGVLVVALERKLPHKRMLIATGLLITAVLVVLVGKTVQTMQVVGWIPVAPVEGVTLPYWAGLWFGVHPTWQGLTAQTLAAVFVIGSYFAAEALRRKRRARILNAPIMEPEPGTEQLAERLHPHLPKRAEREPVGDRA